jgi:MFS family permease
MKLHKSAPKGPTTGGADAAKSGRSVNYLPQRRIGPFDELRPQRVNWDYIKHPLDSTLSRHATEPITSTELANLRYFWLDGIFAATSEAFFLAYIPLFALAYGASNEQIGWITAIGNLLGALALFPGARVMEMTGQRKNLVVWTGGGVARLALFFLALIPLFQIPPSAAIIAITSLNGLRAFMSNFANPAWTALVADLVPNFMRGRYFSTRNLLMGICTLVFTVVAGWLITSGNSWTSNPFLGYQLVFFLAFLAGLGSMYYFSRIDESPIPTQAAGKHTPGQLRRALAEKSGYLGFVVSAIVWNFALQIAAPFFNVYLVSNLGADSATVGLVTSISSVTGIAGQLLMGKWIDRKGAVWLAIATGIPISILPMMWATYTAPWQVGINNAFGGFLWAGYNLANFNLLLQLTPDEGRARAVALYQTGVFAAAVAGPLLGGWLADNVNFQTTFILSGIGRFIAIGLFVWLTAWPLRRLTKQAAAEAV